MHSYTASDVAADDFDLSLLVVPPDEVKAIHAKISALRADLEKKKRSTPPNNNYTWVSDGEILNACDFLTDSHYISMVFSHEYLTDISFAVSSKRYSSWYVQNRLCNWLNINASLAKKVLFHPFVGEGIKSSIVINSLVQIEVLIESIRNKSVLSFPSNIQARLLEICSPEDAKVFVDSDYDKVRLLAYQKIGPLSYLDDMVKDPHALLRKYAVRLLSPGDQRLASFINDRSQDVFIQALSKISVSLIPMMLGSSHLKKKRAKDILNQRLQS